MIRLAGKTAAVLALIVGCYFLAGWIGSSIPRNGGWEEPASGIDIMVETNGTHTGLVVPVVTAVKDWRETFPSAGRPRADGWMPTHISVGWGEREVFMNTPTWGDLKPTTALRIATIGGDAVMRVSHYVRPAPGEWHRPLRVSEAQYGRIVAQIEESLTPPGPDGEREAMKGVAPGDVYYEAAGTYTVFWTSNCWTGDMLGDAGIKMGLWTPFPGGVMKWIEEPDAG